MNKIVYYIASSIDGYIAGLNHDVSGFVQQGEGVDQYLNELKAFRTVIMGRNTYEYAYAFGVKPGQLIPLYAHMRQYVFSDHLQFENRDEVLNVSKMDIKSIQQIRKESDTDIYLCGGGMLAGWLLDEQQIDIVKIKFNPLIIGRGIKIFGNSRQQYRLHFLSGESYSNGLQVMTYKILYQNAASYSGK